jgi:hypothetical protein
VGAQPPEPRSTGLGACAGNARLLAAPNRYLAAGSTAESCLLESADDGRAFGKDHPDQVAEPVPLSAIRPGGQARAGIHASYTYAA